MGGCCYVCVKSSCLPLWLLYATDLANARDAVPPVYSDDRMNQGKIWALTSVITYEWLPSVSNISKSHIVVLQIQLNPPAWFSHVLPPTHLYINH